MDGGGMIERWADGSWEDGVPRVVRGAKGRADRLKALGNAVVPQVAEWVGRRIIEFDARRGHPHG